MASWYEPTPEQASSWAEWVKERPPAVRAAIALKGLAPWKLFRLKGGHRAYLHALDEEIDGSVTLRMVVSGEFNVLLFERTVFGIKPGEIEECELPDEGEPVGSIDVPIEMVRALRPEKGVK